MFTTVGLEKVNRLPEITYRNAHIKKLPDGTSLLIIDKPIKITI